jgi:hypothetical protein
MKLTDRAGMKPCIRFCAGKWLWVNRAGEMELGRGQRNGMNRATLAVRYNPAYELNELIRATDSGEARTGKRERKSEGSECAGVPGKYLLKGVFNLKIHLKPEKTGKCGREGKSQSSHEMTGIELLTGGPLFHAESRLVRARRSQSANRPQNQLTKHRLIPDLVFFFFWLLP